ncbi:MAG: pyridoxamine 5'-phosphate oxidase family protein [Candidatus Omnitrophica bacterium]|nr:pyridoxamine 5'-phosphate oxidase family protein [Candidatus Omnitrophota bacterium]
MKKVLMKELPESTIYLLEKQGFVIVSTLDSQGRIHCSAKGIAAIEKKGMIYLIDVYRANTFNNLKRNSTISVTAVDEHQFTGYSLKGRAEIIEREKIKKHIIERWEEKVTRRASNRVIKNIKGEKKDSHHPEALFPQPEYLIKMEVEEVVDLTPSNLKKKEGIDG